MHAEPPDITALKPGTPPRMVAVLARALAKDPAARYPSGRELHQALVDARHEIDRPAQPAATTSRRAWIAAARRGALDGGRHLPVAPGARVAAALGARRSASGHQPAGGHGAASRGLPSGAAGAGRGPRRSAAGGRLGCGDQPGAGDLGARGRRGVDSIALGKGRGVDGDWPDATDRAAADGADALAVRARRVRAARDRAEPRTGDADARQGRRRAAGDGAGAPGHGRGSHRAQRGQGRPASGSMPTR